MAPGWVLYGAWILCAERVWTVRNECADCGALGPAVWFIKPRCWVFSPPPGVMHWPARVVRMSDRSDYHLSVSHCRRISCWVIQLIIVKRCSCCSSHSVPWNMPMAPYNSRTYSLNISVYDKSIDFDLFTKNWIRKVFSDNWCRYICSKFNFLQKIFLRNFLLKCIDFDLLAKNWIQKVFFLLLLNIG